jgi:uncharacterized phage-associated protein
MSVDEKRTRLIEAAAVILDAAPRKRLNTVSLNKALFYLDLASLRDTGETFTGNTFIAIKYGPVVAKYPKRLIGALQEDGVARQESCGLASPVTLEAMPDTHAMTAEIRQVAREVADFCARRTAGFLSDISHKNPGWDIAWKEGQRKGYFRPINMLIAMQQIADDDPWLQRPLDEEERAACERADVAGSQTW